MTATARQSGAIRAPRPSGAAKQKRLRFADFSMETTPAGRVTCRVTLELGSQQVSAEATGFASSSGDVRLGAQAAIAALELFADNSLSFELIGVRVVKAFDANVVIISLVQHSEDGDDRLLGCYLSETDTVRGAALAVLNATNRVVSSYIVTR